MLSILRPYCRAALLVVSLVAVAGCGGGDDAAAVTPLPSSLSISAPAAWQEVGTAVSLNSSLGTPPAGLTLSWDLGNGSRSTVAQPQASYPRAGVYTVSLTVTNQAGQSHTATSQVKVAELGLVRGKTCSVGEAAGWCWQQPLPQGNNVRAYAFVSDTVGWAAGAAGTMLMTRDGGRKWVAQPTGSTSELSALSFVDENIGWAAGSLGEVLRTTDGGQNWQRLSTGYSVSVVGLKAFDSQTAWVLGTDWWTLTTDGGQTWTMRTRPYNLSGYGVDVVTPSVLWARGYDGLHRSTDAAASWQAINLPALWRSGMSRTIQAMRGIDAQRAVVIATDSGWTDNYSAYQSVPRAFSTTDGGASWRIVEFPADASAQYASLSATSADHLYLFTGSRLKRSTDGGKNWTTVTLPGPANTYFEQFEALTDARWRLPSQRGTSWLTHDAGATWVESGAGGPADYSMSGLWFHDAREGLATLSSGGYLRTSDGGQTWLSVGNAGASGWHRPQFLPGTDLGWALSDQGTVFRTLDKGRTWLAPVPQTSAPMRTLQDVYFIDKLRGWALSSPYSYEGPALYSSTDGGNSWQPLVTRPALADMTALRMIDASNGAAVGPAGVAMQTRDGGQSWSSRPTGSASRMRRLVLAGASTLVAVGDAGAVLRSTDRGQTWQPIATPTREDLYDVQFIDDQRGHAVGAKGTLLRTVDGGQSWVIRPTGTPHALTGVFFLDAYTGWVTGAAGTILVTVTGG